MKGKKETKVERKIYGGIQPLNFSGWQKVLGTADRALTSGFPVEVVGVTGEDADAILHLEVVGTAKPEDLTSLAWGYRRS